MLAHLVQRRATITTGSAHFIEAVDEQRLAGELRAWIEGGEGTRPDVVAAGGRRFALERPGLAGTGIAQQYIGRLGAEILQRQDLAFTALLATRRAGTRHHQVGIDGLAQNQCSVG
ncbi:MAG: hypothetical protein IPN05_11495 [Sulfuritalea sp.]|nr:hypothetical protein [Sulfuritalea sp.]